MEAKGEGLVDWPETYGSCFSVLFLSEFNSAFLNALTVNFWMGRRGGRLWALVSWRGEESSA